MAFDLLLQYKMQGHMLPLSKIMDQYMLLAIFLQILQWAAGQGA